MLPTHLPTIIKIHYLIGEGTLAPTSAAVVVVVVFVLNKKQQTKQKPKRIYIFLVCSPFIRPRQGKLCEAACVVSLFLIHSTVWLSSSEADALGNLQNCF